VTFRSEAVGNKNMPGFKEAQLTPINKIFLEKLIVAQSIKKLPEFYGIRKFISIFTKGDQWTLL